MTDNKKAFILLHILLLVYSLSSVMGKIAAGSPVLGWQFILSYGAMIGFLGLYAIGWQQVIKRMPLTVAYANRAVTVVWGIVWGAILFHETVRPQEVIGALVVLVGIALFAYAGDEKEEREEA